jgi:hypothetical protein
MKKLLLTMSIVVLAFSVKAQVVFNEMVPDPGCQGPNCNEEYFELYNTTGSTVNLDCYTVVAYDFLTGGAWVYQLPTVSITPFGYLVFSSAKPIDYKCGTFDSTTVTNWNTVVTSASLAHYTRVGNDLTNRTVGVTTDFIAVGGGNTAALAIMLFDGSGTLVNGFFTNNNSNIPTEITTLNSLNIPLTGGSCAASATLNFSSISAPQAEVLSVQSAVGNNNDYYRTRDGFCGTWKKGQTCSNPVEYTPGKTNGGAPPISPTTILITVQEGTCGAGTGGTTTPWNVGVTISDATLLPATVTIYSDNDYSQTLTAPDGAAVGGGSVTTTVQTNFLAVPIKKGASAIVQVTTASGCITKTQVFASACSPLPVIFSSFTASRMHSTVALRWSTSTEINNSGFAVERNVNGSWIQIAWVPTQAVNGNSDATLNYAYNDVNDANGISQYRIRQIDIDTKSKYSEIRSVRGDGQLGKLIVFPNPTNDGRVTISFENGSDSRIVSVIDMSGRSIKEYKNVTNNSLVIDNLQPGMYTLKVVVPQTGEQAVQKIVVNKR